MKRILLPALCLALVTIGSFGPSAQAAPPSYTITDLGPVGHDSYAWDVNDTTTVVGQAQTPSLTYEAYRWTAGTMTFLGSLNNSGTSIAHAVNDAGLVVGGSYDGLGGSHAVSWSGGAPTDLGTFAANYSEAFGVNASGQIVGEGCVTLTCYTHALLWEAGGITDLGTLPGGDSSHARGINDAGQIIGDSEITSGGNTHAVIWESAGITDLGTLPGDDYSNGVAINSTGDATGRSGGRAGGGQFAFFWDGFAMNELPMLPGGTFLEAHAINNADQIVGRGDLLQGQTAFLWELSTGQTVDLNALLPSGTGWQLAEADGINDSGQIVGYGYLSGHLHGFLMSPSSDPAPTDIALASVTPGGTVSTDTGDPGATANDPIATTVTTPNEGIVSIREGVSDVALPSGFTILGTQIRISAPPATTTTPLRITLAFDASLIPAGQDETTIQIFRDTDEALPCVGITAADPDPCVLNRQRLTDGDVQITLLTSHASAWTGAYVATPPFPFSGFFSPVANEPKLNRFDAGDVVPVKFGLDGNRGSSIFDAGSPRFRQIDCLTLAPSGTPVSAIGKLAYAANKGRYTFSWATPKMLGGTCQRLTLQLTDGTLHSANFRFGK